MKNQFEKNKRWKCLYCDIMNDYDMDNCDACQAFNENLGNDNKYHNNPKIVHEFPNHNYEKPQPLPELVAKWKCEKCTMLNSFDVELCKACDRKSPHYGKWKCAKCTMMNEKNEKNCSTCFLLNPFIKRCPLCNVTEINTKYNEKCENCVNERKESVKVNDRGLLGNVDKDKWLCSKCSLLNSYDTDTCLACCNFGPLHNSWKCEKCTCINNNSINNCVACGILKPESVENVNIVFALFTTVITTKVENLGCRRCASELTNEDGLLCYRCQREYYECKNKDCGMLMELGKFVCTKCGADRSQNTQINRGARRGWQCTWRKCRFFNEENHEMCKQCLCYRDSDGHKIECKSCGWITYKFNLCKKCGTKLF